MPFPGETWIATFGASLELVGRELRQYYALIQGYLSVEHNDDGSHRAITADSVTSDGNVSAGGIVLSENTVVSTTSAGGAGRPGIKIPSAEGGETWAIVVSRDALNDSLGFFDDTNNIEVLKLYKGTLGSNAYTLTPSQDGITTVGLGDHNDSDLEFDEVAGKNFYARTAVFERARTTALGEWATFAPTWTNLTVGNGTVTAKTMQVGLTTFVDVHVLFGTTTSVGGNIQLTGLPTNNASLGSGYRIGHLGMLDTSASAVYSGFVISGGATTASPVTNASPGVAVNASAPFIWATGDQLHFVLKYREV